MKNHMYITTIGIEMCGSLVTAISQADESIYRDELLNMTALDLLSRLTVNGISFVYPYTRRKTNEPKRIRKD
jgi:hypothetical protein